MALPSFAKETVQVLRAGSVVDHGTNRADWAHPVAPRSVPGCSFQPASGSDNTSYRQAVGGPAQLFMPPGTDVTGLDRILRKGKTYEIVGDIQEWTGPTPRTSNLVLTLHVWTG